MKLIDLEPRWIHPNVFIFKCPCCQAVFLSCKNIAMTQKEQRLLFEAEFGEDADHNIVSTKPEFAWSISGTVPADLKAAFAIDLTVQPSIDASASGHWHGHITNGEIK
jgi:hypothetical protein